MRMRRGNQNAVGTQLGARRRQLFDFIAQFARHHAAVDNRDAQPLAAVIKHDRADVQRRLHLGARVRQHAAVHQHRKLDGRHIDDRRARAELGGCRPRGTQR